MDSGTGRQKSRCQPRFALPLCDCSQATAILPFPPGLKRADRTGFIHWSFSKCLFADHCESGPALVMGVTEVHVTQRAPVVLDLVFL